MKTKLWHGLTLAGVLALSLAGKTFARSDVFSDYSLEQAKQTAQENHKFLLVDFMATWCPPCRQMESTTWGNDTVQEWIKENAIAVQIDVDKDEKDSSAFKIEAMPTIVLFTPQGEIGRQVGYMSPVELLQWLEQAKSGKPPEEASKDSAQTQGDNDVFARLGNAHDLQSAGKNAEAFEQYMWIWNNVTKPDGHVADIRNTVAPVEIKKIIAVLPSARSKILELRDAAEKQGNRKDWLILNGVLSDDSRSLEWFDKIKADPAQRSAVKENTSLLLTVLFSKNRYADAATYLYPQPLAMINDCYKRAEDMKKPRPDTEVSKDFDPFPSMVLWIYGAYLGAGRDQDAQAIEAECLRLDNTPVMRDALNEMAKGMRQARSLNTKAAG